MFFIYNDILVKRNRKANYGHTVRSYEKNIFGYFDIKDDKLRTIYSIEKDIFDKIVVKDAQRKEILSFEKGYFGEQPFEKAAELIIRTIEGNLFDQK